MGVPATVVHASILLALLPNLLPAAALESPVSVQPCRITELAGAKWFDGSRFRSGAWYIDEQGRFTRTRPAHVDRTVHLGGKFLVPAYADAHCHNFSHLRDLDRQTRLYVRDGVLSAKSMTDPTRTGQQAESQLQTWGSPLHVAFAHGGLTGTESHPAEIYEALALGLRERDIPAHEKEVRASRLEENDAYYVIDDHNDLKAKWPLILAGHPDFIKVYVTNSGEYSKRKTSGHDTGINPDILPEVVTRAREAGLRVSAHVETAQDFHLALLSGVNEMAHMPIGISESDAKLAAAKNVDVVITIFDSDVNPSDPVVRKTNRDRISQTISLLRREGVHLAVGYDGYNTDSVNEIELIGALGLFSNAELLQLWSTATEQVIFPTRKVGRIAEGQEATFLVLAANPLIQFKNAESITDRFISGRPVSLR